MSADFFPDFERADALLKRALALAPERRERFVARACGADEALLARVRQLLACAEDEADDGLSPGGALGGPVWQGMAREDEVECIAAGTRFGAWRVHEEIGRGGMAVVYRGQRADGAFEQQVAIKLLHSPRAADELERRFVRERQILAQLEHPNIARLLDGGADASGRSYLVMEYVEGETIDRYCDRLRLSVEARLELFLAVCSAVAFAHRKLIVHRDLKPSNILVTPEGVPKLLDFGIAKLLESDAAAGDVTQTALLDRVLTPQYASPEQVMGHAVSTATDVYALGLLLYELLTGRRARDIPSSRPSEIERAICETDPALPSTIVTAEVSGGNGVAATPATALSESRRLSPKRLCRRLRGDLDNIVMTALRREPERRYASVEQMAADARDHLAGRPVQARADSLAYRAGKFIRRHGAIVAVAAGLVLVIATLVVFYTERLARERDAAEQSAIVARAESERAAAALADTEQALARAEALREFLLDLFRAAQPDRPRDQLPSTEELLALGARRALDQESAAPAERIGMLLAIGRVYLQRYHFDQARPLIDAAVALAREHRSERPQDLAEALVTRAALAWHGGGTLDRAEAALLEAESVAEGEEGFWNIFATARSNRAWVANLRDDQEQSLALLEPLYAQMQQRDDVRLNTRYEAANRLANTYHRLGDLEAAAAIHAEANELARRVFGAESRTYAIHLANSANVERELGRYETSDARNLRAIALYDRIFGDTPAVYRSVARRNRVRTLLAMGSFEEALSELAVSTSEHARVRGVPEKDDASRFFYEGEMLIQMHRWREAETRLVRARELYLAAPERDVHSLIKTEAMLAWALCRQAKRVAAETVLDRLDDHEQDEFPNDNRSRAQAHTARACVDFQAGRHAPALQAIDRALAAVTQPGRVVDRADRMILRASILAAMARHPEAERALQQAETLYRDLGLTGHPLFPEVEAAHREIAP